jgi:CheY-like chemotaxis protein
MARLLIVSRSMALGMRLADQHEVDEHAAEELDALMPEVDADVLVLDLGDPVLAVNTVNSLREAEKATPVLLVSGYQPEWEQVEAQQVEGVHVVPLPITRIALLEGIAILTDQDPADILINLEDAESHGSVAVTSGPEAAAAPAQSPSPTPPAAAQKPSPADAAATRAVRAAAQAAQAAAARAEAARRPAAAPPGEGTAAPAPGSKEAAGQPAVPFESWESATRPAAPGARASNPRPARRPQHDRATLQRVHAEREMSRSAGSFTAEPEPEPNEDGKAAAKPAAAQAPAPSDPPAATDTRASRGQQVPATVVRKPATGRPAGPSPAGTAPAAAAAPADPTVQGSGEVPEVTESDVAGLSYSTSIARPFNQQPPTGQFPLSYPPTRQPSPATQQKWLRTTPLPAPDVPPRPGTSPRTADPGSETPGAGVGGRIQRMGNRPRKLQRRPNPNDATRTSPGMGLVTDPLGPRTDPYGFPVSALDKRLDAEAAALVTARSAAAEGGIVLRTGDLVRMLHDRVGDLYGVSDTAQVLADDVIERADADSAAILVPDGPIWRVSGGVGLRPLERRLVLEDSHWLISEIGSAGRAVLIEDTDIIRQQLAGAPLAAWRHLLAVPVPDVRAIVVLARGREGGPFTDRDLSAVISPVREAAALLAQAVETRRLARMLAPLREADPDPSPRPPR